MNRRGFLGRLAAIAAAPLLLSERDVAGFTPTPSAPVGSTGTLNGAKYIYVRAQEAIPVGALMTRDGRLMRSASAPWLGVATENIQRRHYGWVQISGYASVVTASHP